MRRILKEVVGQRKRFQALLFCRGKGKGHRANEEFVLLRNVQLMNGSGQIIKEVTTHMWRPAIEFEGYAKGDVLEFTAEVVVYTKPLTRYVPKKQHKHDFTIEKIKQVRWICRKENGRQGEIS